MFFICLKRKKKGGKQNKVRENENKKQNWEMSSRKEMRNVFIKNKVINKGNNMFVLEGLFLYIILLQLGCLQKMLFLKTEIFTSTAHCCYYYYYHYFILLGVFHTSISWWFLTGVGVTASLLKSPGLFLIFWPILIMPKSCPLIFKYSSAFTDPLGIVTIGITITFMFQSFFSSQARSRY